MDESTKALMQAGALALVRHGVGWAGVWLVTHGLMTQSDESQWVGITSGIVMAGGTFLWSVIQKKGALGTIRDLQTRLRRTTGTPPGPSAGTTPSR